MTEYLPAAEYTWLCNKDRAKLADITNLFVSRCLGLAIVVDGLVDIAYAPEGKDCN